MEYRSSTDPSNSDERNTAERNPDELNPGGRLDKEDRLRQLLGNQHIWRPGDSSTRPPDLLPSGFVELDELLGGGWPHGALTELLLDGQGIGELRLLMPVLRAVQISGARGHRRQQSCWIAPPYIPYAPALARHGLSLAQLLIVNPEKPADALWAMEQSLRSSACGAVLCWADSVGRQAIRRLQLAAEEAGSRGFLLRPVRFACQATTAPLRIRLLRQSDSLQLEVLRSRYGSTGQVNLPC